MCLKSDFGNHVAVANVSDSELNEIEHVRWIFLILKGKNRFERTKDISFKLHMSGCIILQHKLVIKLQYVRQGPC